MKHGRHVTFFLEYFLILRSPQKVRMKASTYFVYITC